MTNKKIKNIAASVKQRLKTLSSTRHEDPNYTTTLYVLERFLYRLGESKYRDNFLLKGSMLFVVWLNTAHRVTRDIDLLGFGTSNIADLERVFKDICNIMVEEDGVKFLAETVKGEDIGAKKIYSGVRINFEARIEKVKCKVQVDIGFGDAVTPQAQEIEYPCLLEGFSAAKLKVYPIYTVIAEKFEAMVSLDLANSRMKDFYDIWISIQYKKLELDENLLLEAIQATFARRKTTLPTTIPTALSENFAQNKNKQTDWKGFLNRYAIGNIEFKEVITDLRNFFRRVMDLK